MTKLLNYHMQGSGTPLVLVHGWGVSFTIWRELLPLLRADYTLIVPELPGIGESPAPGAGGYYDVSAQALEDLRLALEIEQWAVVGYSIGGWVVRNYVRAFRQSVMASVFVCLVRPIPPAAWLLGLLARIDRRYPNSGDWVLSAWRLRLLIRLLGFNGRNHPLAGVWEAEICRQPEPILKETLRALPGRGRAALDLPANVPRGFIWGRADLLAPPRTGAEHVILRGTHALPMTAAPQVAQAIKFFVDRVALAKTIGNTQAMPSLTHIWHKT
ncbi:MAG: hypothetical protein OHK0052_14170 [Anaerolineales bacterium]